MRNGEVLFRRGGYDVPYQVHVDAGRLEMRAGRPWQNPKTGEQQIGNPVVMITPKGLAWLAASLAADGVLANDVDSVLAQAWEFLSDDKDK